jgi:hypothetical protein
MDRANHEKRKTFKWPSVPKFKRVTRSVLANTLLEDQGRRCFRSVGTGIHGRSGGGLCCSFIRSLLLALLSNSIASLGGC